MVSGAMRTVGARDLLTSPPPRLALGEPEAVLAVASRVVP